MKELKADGGDGTGNAVAQSFLEFTYYDLTACSSTSATRESTSGQPSGKGSRLEKEQIANDISTRFFLVSPPVDFPLLSRGERGEVKREKGEEGKLRALSFFLLLRFCWAVFRDLSHFRPE